ncbi:MAG: MoxR family ATPase [Spirochaetia bacterium]|nr:MoxR family ATPase [Spirochaetia bacterium]MDD7698549.1 MoxR family ATPase [Spirochaetia bacterium]MDY4211500.1 MoxR family ATPase [Treponema sp.]
MYKNVNINESDLNECRALADRCREEAKKRLVGQSQVIDGIITAFVAGGHVLLEGVPGLAKTLAVKTFAEISGLSFKRIQFTPDLLPADLTGTLIYEQSSGRFSVRKGPVFTNVVFADEINRAPAKVQSALLEAMAEGQVTIGETSYRLPEPFFVLATQNPIEQEGTYNLPEAELDRFLMKIIVPYPTAKEEVEIVKTCGNADSVKVSQIFDERSLSKCRSVLENIVCDDKIIEYIVSIVNVTRPSAKNTGEFRSPVNFSKANDDIIRYITYGASPRAGIALLQCAKVNALFQGRSFVLPEDIKAVAPNVLRHRLILSYEASASGITADDIIAKILDFMPLP